MRMLGGGAQGQVFICRIDGINGVFADKRATVKNNDMLAQKKMNEMLNEYLVARNLIHKNLIEYKYFMRKYDIHTLKHEFHIVMELVHGIDMEKYLDTIGRPKNIERVKAVGS